MLNPLSFPSRRRCSSGRQEPHASPFPMASRFGVHSSTATRPTFASSMCARHLPRPAAWPVATCKLRGVAPPKPTSRFARPTSLPAGCPALRMATRCDRFSSRPPLDASGRELTSYLFFSDTCSASTRSLSSSRVAAAFTASSRAPRPVHRLASALSSVSDAVSSRPRRAPSAASVSSAQASTLYLIPVLQRG